MAHEYFIISPLNLPENKTKDIQVFKISSVFHFKITLIKEEAASYHQLPFAGIPSILARNHHRFICKNCNKTCSDSNRFSLEDFLQSYAILDSLAKALHNIHSTYKDIADQFHISIPLIQLYADNFLIASRFSLPVSLGIDKIHSSIIPNSFLC